MDSTYTVKITPTCSGHLARIFSIKRSYNYYYQTLSMLILFFFFLYAPRICLFMKKLTTLGASGLVQQLNCLLYLLLDQSTFSSLQHAYLLSNDPVEVEGKALSIHKAEVVQKNQKRFQLCQHKINEISLLLCQYCSSYLTWSPTCSQQRTYYQSCYIQNSLFHSSNGWSSPFSDGQKPLKLICKRESKNVGWKGLAKPQFWSWKSFSRLFKYYVNYDTTFCYCYAFRNRQFYSSIFRLCSWILGSPNSTASSSIRSHVE